MDTARAEAREERREVKRGKEGEQSQWAVVQKELQLGNTEQYYMLREKLGFNIKLLI